MYFLPQDSVTFVWLMLLGVTGIVNITTFPGIFRSFDPSRAVLCMLNILSSVYALNDPPRVYTHKGLRQPCRGPPSRHRLRSYVCEVSVW